ncbi:hypothetical protein DV737_g4179, partial [Chaetothyriales sp. CBS 132003]
MAFIVSALPGALDFFPLKEWAAANADYEADVPPFWHAKPVPDAFSAIGGVFWSISYILMARKAFQDKSYAMPIACLCLNLTWEIVYGFVYGPGLVNQVVFAQWVFVDLFLAYATVKSGKYQWKHSPLIARNLGWIILVGCVLCTWLHLSIAATFVPRVGREVVFFTAWPMQLLISIGSIAQLLSRGHTGGHSMAICFSSFETAADKFGWDNRWTRMLGTTATGCCFAWRIYFWPKRFGYAWTPYGAFLLITCHCVDLVYPVAFMYIRAYEKRNATVNGNSVYATAHGKKRN